MSIYNKKLFVCECGSIEHQMVFMYENDEKHDIEEVYLEVHLNNYMGFWKRLVHGIKYIFGFQSKYGAFDSIILDPDDYKEFQEVATKLTELHVRRENRELLAGNKNEIRS